MASKNLDLYKSVSGFQENVKLDQKISLKMAEIQMLNDNLHERMTSVENKVVCIQNAPVATSDDLKAVVEENNEKHEQHISNTDELKKYIDSSFVQNSTLDEFALNVEKTINEFVLKQSPANNAQMFDSYDDRIKDINNKINALLDRFERFSQDAKKKLDTTAIRESFDTDKAVYEKKKVPQISLKRN